MNKNVFQQFLFIHNIYYVDHTTLHDKVEIIFSDFIAMGDKWLTYGHRYTGSHSVMRQAGKDHHGGFLYSH